MIPVRSALFGLALASCAAPPDGAARREAPVVEGFEPENADATVTLGFFVWGDFQSNCSGSLVAPNVVLTAKHCIPDWPSCDPRWLSVGFGPDGLDDQIRVREAICSENSCNGDDCPPGWVFQYEDIALVVLEEPIDAVGGDLLPLHPDIAHIQPYPIAWDGDGLEEGAPVRLIGYGRTETGASGHRLATDDVVTTVYDDEFVTTGNGVCPGDSGGSAVDDLGRVVGINVRGIDDGCVVTPPARVTYLTRVTHWLDVVTEAFRRAEACTPLSPEECDGWDNDCDREVDEGCGFEGDPCDVLRPETSCADGFFCQETGCNLGICTAGAAGNVPLGGACTDDVDCSGLRCGGGLCTRACAPGAGMCGVGLVCSGPDLSCPSCVDESAAAPGGARGLGEPCDHDADCAAGACHAGLDGRSCTESCTSVEGGPVSCPAGWHCSKDECLRGEPAAVGEPCTEDGECASGACGRWDEGSSCTAACGADAPCPDGSGCDASGYCKPLTAITGDACTDNGDCLSGLCGRFGYADLCTETCSAWDACPDGFDCIPAAQGLDICARPRIEAVGGGCRTGGTGGAGAAILVALAIGLARRRRAA